MAKKFWLKFHDNFFEDEKIAFLMSHKNGHKYVVVFLKLLNLCIKKARTDGEENLGILRFSEKIPYNPELLSQIFREDVELISVCMGLFEKANLIDIRSDETIFIEEIARLTGKESESAERVRKHRELKASKALLLQSNDTVTKSNNNKDLEKELEKEEDKSEAKASEAKSVIEEWNTKSPKDIPKLRQIPSTRLSRFKRRISEGMSLDAIFERVKNSDFLQGKNDRQWVMDFDWLTKNETNWVKVMESKYDNKKDLQFEAFKKAQEAIYQ